jgi:hypothetical protein
MNQCGPSSSQSTGRNRHRDISYGAGPGRANRLRLGVATATEESLGAKEELPSAPFFAFLRSNEIVEFDARVLLAWDR